MSLTNTRNLSKSTQFLFSVSTFVVVAVTCFLFSDFISYKIVSLILLLTVSVIAMLFDIFPVLVVAFLSAIVWNFFFIPPIFTFHIGDTEDFLMFLLYFFIAFINAVLSFKIRKEEKKVREKEEKENSIKLYNTLLNSLSHELKTPISTIIGAIDTLKENQNNLSKSNQLSLLNEIDIASFRLNRQVENLLNMSRLETGFLKLNYDWCDINDLVNGEIHKLILNENQRIDFESSEDLPFFKLDRGLLEEVVKNLLHNAINYAGNNITIQVNVIHQDDYFVLEIKDDGVGVKEEFLESIFEKFYRISETNTGGSGLGLSIVKGFVEAHKGIILVQKNNPSGLIFTVKIPAESSYIKNFNHV